MLNSDLTVEEVQDVDGGKRNGRKELTFGRSKQNKLM